MVKGPPRPSISHLASLSLSLIPHLSASSAGFLCPTPLPGAPRETRAPGSPSVLWFHLTPVRMHAGGI